MNNDFINMTPRDSFDFSLLNNQVIISSVFILSNFLSINASLQGMDILINKYTNSINYTPDPDIPALLGAKCSLFAQLLLTQITSIKLNESIDDFNTTGDSTIIQTNPELYISNILFSLGYSYGLVGIQKIFDSHHTGPIIGL